MALDSIFAEVESEWLTKRLEALPASLANKGARKGTRAGAKRVLAQARSLVPNDSGDLYKSLKVRSRKRSRKDKGTVGHSVYSGGTKSRVFSGKTYYGSFVELGTSKQEAQPFLRVGLWSSQDGVRSDFNNELKKWIHEQQLTDKSSPLLESDD